MADFDKAFKFTIGNEGGYTVDTGGPTMWGVTQATLSRWLGRPASIPEVKALSLDTAKAIYKKWWWDTLSLDNCKWQGSAECIFDQGINAGLATGAKLAQQVLGVVQDGHFGPVTIKSLNDMPENVFVPKFEKLCENRYQALGLMSKYKAYLKGWLNRARRYLGLKDI